MGTVNSDHVKASSEGAFGTSNESCYDPLNIVFRELVRLSILLIERKGTCLWDTMTYVSMRAPKSRESRSTVTLSSTDILQS